MEKTKTKESYLLSNGLIGIALMLIVSSLFNSSAKSGAPELRKAAEIMEQSLIVIKNYCIEHQINTDNPEDPRQSGLIGPEWSEITTTIGDQAAKRTTINPNFAALIAHLLQETGVKKGDTIAIGSSASFPALLIASLSAVKALELHPLVIISFGSSSYGASNPDFTLWDIYNLLLEHQYIDVRPVAASMGGEDDTGSEFKKGITDRIRISLLKAGIPLISEKDLQKNIKIRNGYYFADGLAEALSSQRKACPREGVGRGSLRPAPIQPKAFINSGGGYANIGSSQSVLKIKPGLIRRAQIPEPAKQGIIHAMLLQKIPVIHLLFIKGLVQKYNLPWDPATQPEITGHSVQFDGNRNPVIMIICLIGLLWFIVVLFRFRMLYNSHEKPFTLIKKPQPEGGVNDERS